MPLSREECGRRLQGCFVIDGGSVASKNPQTAMHRMMILYTLWRKPLFHAYGYPELEEKTGLPLAVLKQQAANLLKEGKIGYTVSTFAAEKGGPRRKHRQFYFVNEWYEWGWMRELTRPEEVHKVHVYDCLYGTPCRYRCKYCDRISVEGQPYTKPTVCATAPDLRDWVPEVKKS